MRNSNVLKFAFLVFAMWNAVAFADVVNSAAELRVPANTKYSIPPGSALLIVDSLVLEKGATLEVASGASIFTIRAKKSEFGEGTTISAKGPDGAQGQNGWDGTTLHLYLGDATFLGTKVDTTGGTGGKGVTGSKGRNGLSASCPSDAGGNGAPGGKGKTGGIGGKGGDIHVYASNSQTLPTNLLLLPAGGKKGQGGDGGSGGDFGHGTRCGPWPYWYLGSGYNGPQGSHGDEGQDGSPGQVTYNQLSDAKAIANLRNIVKKTFPKLLQNSALKQVK